MIAFILAPTNSRLNEYAKKALETIDSGNILQFRGEDIPLAVYKLSLIGKKAIGLTGEDIYREFLIKNPNSGLFILKKIEWKDNSAMFGKPALCLMGPEGKSLEALPKGRLLNVGVNAKYKELARKYLNRLGARGYKFRKIAINGQCETAIKAGFSDMVIDIVYTGRTMSQAGLKAYERIIESDFVIIGAKKFWGGEDGNP